MGGENGGGRRVWPAAGVVLVLTALAYLPVLGNGFTNWDDDLYILDNPLIRLLSFDRIGEYFTSFQLHNYHPLTLLALALEYAAFGTDPRGYHAVSLGLHLLNTLLVLFLLRGLEARTVPAAAGALLFGLHPLHVESVAWAAELKDVLSAAFALATLLAWRKWRRSDSRGWYATALGAFCLALLAKPTPVTLPLVLLLFDRLEGRTIDRRALWEKAPFLVPAVACGVLTLLAQQGALRPFGHFPWWQNLFVASGGLVFYLAKAVVPTGLSNLYLYPLGERGELALPYLLAPAVLAFLGLAVAPWVRRSRGTAFGLVFFLVTLLPVLQIIPVGNAAMADRYFYLPSVGLAWLAAEGLAALAGLAAPGRGAGRAALVLGFVLAASILGTLTWNRALVWRDSLTLWSDALRTNPESYMAWGYRGEWRHALGDADGALRDYERGLAAGSKRGYAAVLHFNRGLIYHERQELSRAFAEYDRSMAIEPSAKAAVNRGNLLDTLGRPEEALAEYDRAIGLDPRNHLAPFNRGLTLTGRGEYPRALADFSRALDLDPWYVPAYLNRAQVRSILGDERGAAADRAAATRLQAGENP